MWPEGNGQRRGSVLPLSENDDHDWAIVPFEEYMHGFESPALLR